VVTFAPRPEFAQAPVTSAGRRGRPSVFATNDPMVLRSPGVEWEIVPDGIHQTARAVSRPVRGPCCLELRCGTEDLTESPVTMVAARTRGELLERLGCSAGAAVAEPSLMKRSALTLRGLVHADTGAIMAAATTSLPEEIGGVRNWDYRYCWIRDAAHDRLGAGVAGLDREAEGYLNWLHGVIETMHGPERLHPLYALSGAILGPEAVIDSLPGYAGSRPVRVGNAANVQVQLDVFGPWCS
jgi:trehalose 6-phosphate phosphatase